MGYGYRCLLEPLMFPWVNIGAVTPICISRESDLFSFGYKVEENASISIYMKNYHN